MLLYSSRRRLRSLHTRIRPELALLLLLLNIAFWCSLLASQAVQAIALPKLFIRLIRLPEQRSAPGSRIVLRFRHLRRRRIATIRRRLERRIKDLDKVAREKSNSSGIAPQSSHPPQSIASIQCLDQIALDEAQVLLVLAAPREGGLDPARETWEVVGHRHRVQCGDPSSRGGGSYELRGSITSCVRGDVG